MEPDAIYAKLTALAPGGVLALPAGAFGLGTLKTALAEYCEGGELRATGVKLRAEPTEVLFEGTGTNPPFTGMTLRGRFVPDPNAPAGALMTLTATAAPSWNLATSWPLLEGSFGEGLPLAPTTLTLGTGIAGDAPRGLAFSGRLGFGGTSPLAPLSWLLSTVVAVDLGGKIAAAGPGVPVFDLETKTPLISIPGLGDELKPSLALSCEAIPRKGVLPASYTPLLDLALRAVIPLGPGVPVRIDLTSPGGLVAIDADVTRLTGNFLELLGTFLGVGNLGAWLPKSQGFDPTAAVELVDLGLTINPARRAVTSARIELATSPALKWPLAEGIDIERLGFELVVPFGAPKGTPSAFATAFGTVALPGGALDISGSYGDGFQLAAGLEEGSKVKVTDLLNQFHLPTKLDAELYLDELEMLATTKGDWGLVVGLVGDWSVSVGIVQVALLEAWIELEHEAEGTTGAIEAKARIGPGPDAPTFTGLWALPGTFALRGEFPRIDLAALAGPLTGKAPPPGLPEVTLDDAVANITLHTGEPEYYDFALAASAEIGGVAAGRAGFDVRKDEHGFGFLIGFALPEGFSPTKVWPSLPSAFGSLTFHQSGLVVSTLEETASALTELAMPSLPATVGPGVTFFTSLELTGPGIHAVGELLPDGTKLNLLAMLDLAESKNTVLTASLASPEGRGSFRFTGLSLTLQPALMIFTLRAKATLTLTQGKAEEKVALEGAGRVKLDPDADFELEAAVTHWPEPFGIPRLTVEKFGVEFGLDPKGVTVGALGAITIEQDEDSFELTIGAKFVDFEAPEDIVFELKSLSGKTLWLASLVAKFTGLKVREVPLLGGIGFADLKLWLIGDPGGWTIAGYHYPQGIAVHADLTLYSWELILDIEVSETKGIKAEGSVSEEIDLYGVLRIASFQGGGGPSAKIDTATIAAGKSSTPYLWLDGAVDFMGIEKYAIHAEVSGTAFDFELEFEFLKALKVKLECALVNDTEFRAGVDFEFDLDLTLGPLVWNKIKILPTVHIVGPTGKVSVGILVNKSVIFKLKFGLAFQWGSVHVNVNPTFTAADLKSDLTKLWSTAERWMRKNLEVVFAELVHDAKRWIAASRSGLFALEADAEEVAHLLAGYFEVGVEEAAELLSELEFAFDEMVAALVRWFEIGVEEAVRLLGAAVESCAINSAYAELGPEAPPAEAPSRTLFALTRSPTGQQMLLHYHSHREELEGLAAADPRVRVGLTAIAVPAGPDDDRQAVVGAGVEVLKALRVGAGPDLCDAIDETLPQLERRAGMTHDEFIADLSR